MKTEQTPQALERAQTQPQTPMTILHRAVESGTSVEVMERLLDLQQRWEAGEAKKAFDRAMAQAKAKIPVMHKGNTVDFTSAKGRTHYRYEDLSSIARTIDPILSEHGLSYRFRTESTERETAVTCILSHEAGHSEECKLNAPNDLSGNKNPLQAIGSAVTYLQRYTLKAALGLSASADDDARSVSTPGQPPSDRPNFLQKQPQTTPAPKGAPTPMASRKKPVEPKPDPTKADLEAFISEVEPIREQMRGYMIHQGILIETEDIEDCPFEKVPVGEQVHKVVERCLAWVKEQEDAAQPPNEFQPPEGAKSLTGFVRMVKEKPTAKGGTNYSILIVEFVDDREGGDWIGTFDDVDGAAAKTLEGAQATVWFGMDRTGKYKNLCHRGILPA